MQPVQIPDEISQRLGTNQEPSTGVSNQLRAELNAQVAEYLKNGGKITQIPSGLSALADGLMPTDGSIHCIGVARTNKRQRLSATAFKSRTEYENFLSDNGRLMNKAEVAEILGYRHLSTLTNHINTKKLPLKIVKRVRGRVYYEREAVLAIARAQKRKT